MSRAGVPGREDDIRWLIVTGEDLNGACRRLGVTRKGLWKWCARHGCLDLYETLASRQRIHGNQHRLSSERSYV